MRTSDSPDSPTNGAVSSGDEKHGKVAAAPSSTKKARGAAARNSTAASSTAAGKRTSTRNRGGEKNKEARKEGVYLNVDYFLWIPTFSSSETKSVVKSIL